MKWVNPYVCVCVRGSWFSIGIKFTKRKESNFPLRDLTTEIIIRNPIADRTQSLFYPQNDIKEYRISIRMMMQEQKWTPPKCNGFLHDVHNLFAGICYSFILFFCSTGLTCQLSDDEYIEVCLISSATRRWFFFSLQVYSIYSQTFFNCNRCNWANNIQRNHNNHQRM